MIEDLRYYLAVVHARLHYVVLIFVAVTAAAVIIALRLHHSFDSSATLMLQGPRVTDVQVASTVNTSAVEQLQVLKDKLMTRHNLLDIARKLNVLPNAARMKPDEIVTAMRKSTTINISTGQNQFGNANNQVSLLTISFTADGAQKAADVVNAFVAQALAENLSARTTQIRDTVQFFRQEVDRLHRELATQSAKILAYQNANTDALPSTLDARMQQQTTLQLRLTQIDNDISGLQDQKQRLIELSQATGQNSNIAMQTPAEKLLEQARADLADALAVYAPDSAKVRMLRGRITQLKAAIKTSAGTPSSPAKGASMLSVQAGIEARIKQLEAQRGRVKAEVGALKASIDRTPQVSVELDALNRKYANIQGQYNAAVGRFSTASTAARIEAQAKGQRIVVLDPATVPDYPARPHRKRIALFGAAAGLALGVGFVVLLEISKASVSRPVDLIRSLDITPIVAIPYMQTPRERLRKRFLLIGLLLALVVGLPFLLFTIADYYKPLAGLLSKIGLKQGL